MGKPIFAYYGSWANYRGGIGSCKVDDINPHLCTHLIYAFVGLHTDGAIESLDDATLRRFNNLRDRNGKLKTLVAIGGANHSRAFSEVASSAQKRYAFARNARHLCEEYGFNGVDIDWEFPDASDRSNFVKLLSALSNELRSHGLMLTTSVGPSEWRASQSYDIPDISRCVDYILLMTYDYHGIWSTATGHNAPLYGSDQLNINHSVNYWVRHGAPKSKLILGLAAYGRSFTLRDGNHSGMGAPIAGPGTPGPYTNEAGTLAYYEVKNGFNLQNRVWDNEQYVPYVVSGNQWVGYDDEYSIRKKCEYIKSNGLGGAMLWSIDMDECHGGKFTLLRTIAHSL